MAELAFGLLCGCLPIIPRLYQHIASVPPYSNNNPTTCGASDQAGKRSYRMANMNRDWTLLDGHSRPSMPSQAHVTDRSASDDQALESAIEGKSGDGEMG